MKFRVPYPGLEQTLRALKLQVIDSLPFARRFLPSGKMRPEAIYNFLKGETIYWNDPAKTELVQSMQTMFSEANHHNVYGAGDCDCFTVAALASLVTKGYDDLAVCLAGRRPDVPVHIYAAVNGAPFDLTNEQYGHERPYPYKQRIAFRC